MEIITLIIKTYDHSYFFNFPETLFAKKYRHSRQDNCFEKIGSKEPPNYKEIYSNDHIYAFSTRKLNVVI